MTDRETDSIWYLAHLLRQRRLGGEGVNRKERSGVEGSPTSPPAGLASSPTLCCETRELRVMQPDRSHEDRVYTCTQPSGHSGAHVGGSLMWPAGDEAA